MLCDKTKQASREVRWNQLSSTWKTSLKMTTQTSKKNSKDVNISSFTLSFKNEDIVFSISPGHPSTTLWLLKRFDLGFRGLKCAAKVDLAFGFVLKNVEDGSCRYSCAHKRNYRKRILLIIVHERESIPNGSFTNWQIWQFLQHYSKMYPWVVKILYYLNRSWKTKLWIVWRLKKMQKALRYQSLLFHSSCSSFFGTERSEEETSKIFNIFLNNCGRQIHPSSSVFTWLIFRKWRRCCNSIFFFTTLTLLIESWLGN